LVSKYHWLRTNHVFTWQYRVWTSPCQVGSRMLNPDAPVLTSFLGPGSHIPERFSSRVLHAIFTAQADAQPHALAVGSTGRPKWVMIEHRSAWHLVRVEGSIFQLQREDHVIAAPPEVARAAPNLWRFLREQGVTVLPTVGPTETTVIATCTDLSPGTPVRIGRAIPGYRVHLLDESAKVPRLDFKRQNRAKVN